MQLTKPNTETLIKGARVLFTGFLLLLIYDGALRKWGFQGGERLIFILKDVAILAAFALAMTVFLRERPVGLPRPVTLAFLAYVGWVILEVLNPRLPNLWVGLWGLKTHLLYVSLLFVLPVVAGNLDCFFEKAKKLFPFLVVPVCLVAFAQVYAPPDSLINNPVRGGTFFVSTLGDKTVRTTGTFSYITGMTWFIQGALLIGAALVVAGKRSWGLGVSLAMLLFVMPTNGSRSVVIVVVASLGIMLAASLYTRLVSPGMLMKFLAAIAVTAIAGYLFFPDVWGGLVHRFLTSSVVEGDSARYYSAFTNAFAFFELAGWNGYGVGAAAQAAPFLVPGVEPYAWLPAGIGTLGFEEESGRIVVELGVVGWVLSLALRVVLLIWALFLAFGRTSRNVKAAAILALPVMALGVHVGNGVFAPPVGGSLYWLCAALLAMASRESAGKVSDSGESSV